MKLLISVKVNKNKTIKPVWHKYFYLGLLVSISAHSGKMYNVTQNKIVCVGKGNVKHVARQSP